MKDKHSTGSQVPHIVPDKSLDQLRGKVLFPEKLERAEKFLAKAGLPNLLKDKNS